MQPLVAAVRINKKLGLTSDARFAVLNEALASGNSGRHLTSGDLGKGILDDVAAAATDSPATIFSDFVKSIVSQAQDFSKFDQSQLGDFSASSSKWRKLLRPTELAHFARQLGHVGHDL